MDDFLTFLQTLVKNWIVQRLIWLKIIKHKEAGQDGRPNLESLIDLYNHARQGLSED